MALRTAYRHTSDGIRVPYRGIGDNNRGFVDLRARPDLARTIVEARESTALRCLLVHLAAPDSPLFSLGCDLGVHEAKGAPPDRRHVAGGYLHAVSAAYETPSAQAYHAFARLLESAVARNVDRRNWELAFLLQDVEIDLDGRAPHRCPSLSVCFYASASNVAAARYSREALIGALDAAIAQPAVLQALACER